MQSVEKLLFTSQRTQFHLEGFISYSVPHLHSGCDSSFALTAGEKTPGWVCLPEEKRLILTINVKGFGFTATCKALLLTLEGQRTHPFCCDP